MIWLAAGAFLLVSAADAGQPAPVDNSACIDLRATDRMTFAGRLTRGRFPSPSVSAPSEGEQSFILALPGSICIDDGGDFADPTEQFRTIHVWGSGDLARRLSEAIGHDVELRSTVYASHSGHHHAPLVMQVADIVEAAE